MVEVKFFFLKSSAHENELNDSILTIKNSNRKVRIFRKFEEFPFGCSIVLARRRESRFGCGLENQFTSIDLLSSLVIENSSVQSKSLHEDVLGG